MIYSHYSLVPSETWRWPNFSPLEIACPCCGEVFLDVDAMDKLQRTREIMGKPLRINSAHRCPIHNARVGGAPLSQHKKIAFDISTHGHDRQKLYKACVDAGFTTFGFYTTFLHVDTRLGRRWYSSERAKELWNF